MDLIPQSPQSTTRADDIDWPVVLARLEAMNEAVRQMDDIEERWIALKAESESKLQRGPAPPTA